MLCGHKHPEALPESPHLLLFPPAELLTASAARET